MRIGLAEQSVLLALAQAIVLHEDLQPRNPETPRPNSDISARVEEAERIIKQVWLIACFVS